MLGNLQRLRIEYDGVSLPELLSGLQRLTSLHLTSCWKLVSIPSWGSGLRELAISGCRELETLPGNYQAYASLTFPADE